MSHPAPVRLTAEAAARSARTAGALLAAHVPLTLLLDLADPTGPASAELLAAEPGSADWLPAPRRSAA